MPSKTLECSHATGEHDEPCDIVAGLQAELAALRGYVAKLEDDNADLAVRVPELARCLSHERCYECGQRYNVDPATGMCCMLADHVEAYAAISGKAQS